MKKTLLCKNCGGEHELKKCMKGRSYKDMKKDETAVGSSDMSMSEKKAEPAKPAKPSKMKKSLIPGMTYQDLRKAEENLAKAEQDALDLAQEAREALEAIRAKLAKK